MTWFGALLFALSMTSALGGCGGPRGAPQPVATEGPLGPRIDIPGTGVSLEPPRGAELVPVGPGVFVDELDITIMTSVLMGGAAERDAVARSFALDREGAPPRSITIDGVPAELGRDVVRLGGGARPRAWLLAARDHRVLTIMATFPVGEDGEVEALVERSLATVHWRRDEPLDPALAIGLTLGEVDGLRPDVSTVGTLALVPFGTTFPPPEGQPFIVVLPLPHAVPSAPDSARCAEVLDDTRVLTSREGEVTELDERDETGDGERAVWGCHAEGEHVTSTGAPLYAHTSVVVLDVGPFLVTGMVALEGRQEWTARFRETARQLRPLRAPFSRASGS